MNCFSVTEDEYRDHVANNDGICAECGEWTCGGVEPDAEEYPCDACEANAVMGAEQALIVGVADFGA
jgi:hypothetical protein